MTEGGDGTVLGEKELLEGGPEDVEPISKEVEELLLVGVSGLEMGDRKMEGVESGTGKSVVVESGDTSVKSVPIKYDQLNRLQRIQNAAARLIYGKKKRDHITPLLKQLHWLPVKARCHYKIATLVYQFFDGSLAPSLASHLQKYQPSRNLRSSNENLLLAQRYSLKTAGGRTF